MNCREQKNPFHLPRCRPDRILVILVVIDNPTIGLVAGDLDRDSQKSDPGFRDRREDW
jgi:hypothetical protein